MIESGVKDNNGNSVGFDYVCDLGITHIQLMPIYDYGSIDESDESVEYNWGYDPVQFNVMEGKYSCNPNDPYERINEVIAVVNGYSDKNIGVNMDVVYNHVYDAASFSYQKIVPYYFFRYKGDEPSNASYCGNETASERYMVRRFIVDSIVYLTKTFGFSGYRFDLMGILDCATMNVIKEKLEIINPSIHIYGEGWSMPCAIEQSKCATQKNYSEIPGIGFFNDDFRNSIKQLMVRHINSGVSEIVSRLIRGEDYGKMTESVAYMSCHDDYTIYDEMRYGFGVPVGEIVARIKLGYIFILLGQGTPFIHSGCEALRTKEGIKNTYNSSEYINRISWKNIEINNGLVDFVRELIRVRNSEEFLLYNSREEVGNDISIVVENDCVRYELGSLIIYINLGADEKVIEGGKNIMSIDGMKNNLRMDGEIRYKSYMVEKK